MGGSFAVFFCMLDRARIFPLFFNVSNSGTTALWSIYPTIA